MRLSQIRIWKLGRPGPRPMVALRLLLCNLLVLGSAAAAQAQLAVKVDPTSVRAAGVTPGGAVTFIGVGRERFRPTSTRRYFVAETLTAVTGSVALEPAKPVPFLSTWVVVDQASGRVAIASRDGFVVPVARGLRAERTFDQVEIEALSEEATVLLVRRGASPWIFTGDRDRHVGAASSGREKDGLNVTGFLPLSRDQGTVLAGLEPSDLVIVVDQATLEVAELLLP